MFIAKPCNTDPRGFILFGLVTSATLARKGKDKQKKDGDLEALAKRTAKMILSIDMALYPIRIALIIENC